MSTLKVWCVALVLVLSFVAMPAVWAQNENETAPDGEQTGGEENKGFLKGILDVLGGAAKDSLQEGIDEWAGNYKGRIGEVRLMERRGNLIVLEVRYEKVKRSDGVYVRGDVLKWGAKLEGFSNTLTPISGKRGRVRLTIGRIQGEDTGWGTVAQDVVSDQIRLVLVRESHPERPFGELIYDLAKTWTQSDEADLPPEQGEETAGIELAEGETAAGDETTATGGGQGTGAEPGPFVIPGTIMRPSRTPVVTRPAGAPAATTAPAQTGQRPEVRTQGRRTIAAVSPGVKSYSFFENASTAEWRSASGRLPFPGLANDKRGFARVLQNGTLSPNTRAVSLLQTHPQWKNRGWIEGRFPAMTLGAGVRFKAICGFLKGAKQTDGATFKVYVKDGKRYKQAAYAKVTAGRYKTLEADLSRWVGRRVQIILRVMAGSTSTQDWAVWVKPRLTQK